MANSGPPSLPHVDAGDLDCPGFILPHERPDGRVELVCNDCGQKFGILLEEYLQKRLNDIERSAKQD